MKLSYDGPLSNVAFKFKLRRYSKDPDTLQNLAVCSLHLVGPAGICRYCFWHNRQIDNSWHMLGS